MTAVRDFERRLERLWQVMRERELAAVLLVGVFPEKEGHVAYLTGFRIWTPQWPTGAGLTGAGFSFVIVTLEMAELFATRVEQNRLMPFLRAVASDDLFDAVATRLDALAGPNTLVGVAGLDILPYPLARRLSLSERAVDLGAEMFEWRLHKSNREQEILAEGARLAVGAIDAAVKATRPGRNNQHIAAAAVGRALELGAEHVLRCRLRSGNETGVVRWPYASDRELVAGDFVQIDLVGIHKGYLFDVSRVWVAGEESSKHLEAIGLATQLTASLVGCLGAGISIAAAVEDWRQNLALPPDHQANLEGHSIGIDVVEPPWIAPSEALCLQDGMVFCVEPSVTLADGSVLKVEDTVLIRAGGNVVLSAA